MTADANSSYAVEQIPCLQGLVLKEWWRLSRAKVEHVGEKELRCESYVQLNVIYIFPHPRHIKWMSMFLFGAAERLIV